MAVETIHNEMLTNIDNKYDKSNGSFAYDITKSVAVVVNKQEEKIDSVLNKVDVEKLNGEELEKFIFQRTGIERKQATFATTTVTVTGVPFARINTGDLFAANNLFYQATQTVDLDASGKANVEVQCQVAGTVGNVPSGAINSFPITLSNIHTVTNPSTVSNGYDKEIDADLRNRYYEKLRYPGKSGNKHHYREWALSVPGVGKVKVFPLWNGPLTVKVSVVDANNNPAPQELLNDVFAFIEEERPFGAIVIVEAPVQISVNITATLTLANGYGVTNALESISQKVDSYLKSLIFESDYVSYSQIGKLILEAEGVVDYSNLLINDSETHLTIGENEIAVLGEVSAS
ncbi:putative phage protein gp47/JayE [Lysinibacillus composti]|uniref:Baseplate J/gp47 family protein n=1 Tax=Lysinibacillus composti TaxID=720633 RepID=A0A3N9UIM4_9BACI|nr:baseplate J/gp47 family protein [Lysinibacillus composti]MBM7607582.1 putative phage protein gp47/JayE [Lysinibacillus composti]RQW75913.1 baseplate J/gp47 family protein [Lysinibacillus composti]